MKKTISLIAIIFCSMTLLAQKNKVYRSLEEVKQSHPDSVYNVHLINFEGENIPEELFACNNLRWLMITGEFEEDGKPRKISPFKDLTGISKFNQLKSLDISNTSVSELPDELFELIEANGIFNLNIVGTKITTVSKFQGKSVKIDLEISQITSVEEQNWLKDKIRNGGVETMPGRVPKKIYHYNMYAN